MTVDPARTVHGSMRASWPISTPAVDPRRLRVDDRDPVAHVLLGDPSLHATLGIGQRDPVVDADRIGRIVGDDDRCGAALVGGERDHVGEVQLPGRGCGHASDRLAQPRELEGIRPGIHLVEGQGRLIGVGLLDDRRDPAIRPANDPAVARRVVHPGADERERRAAGPLLGDDALEERWRQHRRVAHRDEHDAIGAGNGLETDADGVARSALRLLAHRGGSIADRGLHRLGPVPGHDHRALHADRREGVEDMEDERAAGKRVQHLRDAGAHADALARGQDDGLGRGQDGRHVARW